MSNEYHPFAYAFACPWGYEFAMPLKLKHKPTPVRCSRGGDVVRKSSQEYRYLESLFTDSKLVQLGAYGPRGVDNSWHHEPDSLIAKARTLAGEGVLLCTSLNRPMYSSRVTMSQEEYETAKDAYRTDPPDYPGWNISNDNVVSYQRLLFDFDRKKSGGRNATADELAEALDLRDRFVEYMAGLGWTAPALATSGNGGHALYRTSFGVGRAEELAQVYKSLSDTFQTERVKLDTTTHNPARLCRLYGTINRKYPNLEASPQRVASIVLPREWDMVSIPMVDDFIEAHRPKREVRLVYSGPKRRDGRPDWRTLDIVEWFKARGMYRQPLSGGRHAVDCPWQLRGDHDVSCYDDTIIWEAGNPDFPTFYCRHDTCQGRGSLKDLGDVMGGIADFCGGSRND